MSLASAIIADAADAVGLGSELLATDATITARALLSLQSYISGLKARDYVFTGLNEATAVDTTLVYPATAATDLVEPTASREHLVNALAIYMIPYGRVTPDSLRVPALDWTTRQLATMYRTHVVPTKVPSTLLSRGEGSRRGKNSSTFFQGEALDNDAT